MVHLDIRHLGEKKINERLPMVRELARSYVGIDPVHELIPVRPVVHYMMGGIHTDIDAATSLPGLFAAGECACVSINGANRLGSNSLAEIVVFGARAGRGAAAFAKAHPKPGAGAKAAEAAQARLRELFAREGGSDTVSGLRKAMNDTMESGAGIYRSEDTLRETCGKLAELRARYRKVPVAGPQQRLQHRPDPGARARLHARCRLGHGAFGAASARSRAARTSASNIPSATTPTISSTAWRAIAAPIRRRSAISMS